MGIESTNASLLVNKILDEAPPLQTDIKILNESTEELFRKTVDDVISTFVGIVTSSVTDAQKSQLINR